MTQSTPLLQRPEDAPLAWLSGSLNELVVPACGLTISNCQFLAHVVALADNLPEGDYALNLCDNRYLFMVAICAVVLAKQTNLLPPNKNLKTQIAMLRRYQNAYVLHDGSADLPDNARSFDLSKMDWSLSQYQGQCPRVPLAHLALISFTSGSTGQSKPNLKYWHTLQQSTKINANYMLPNSHETFFHLATVPGQHMWGLETSVLLPMFANACLVDARPLYPHDILAVLAQLPTPRTIIATPLHLKALAVTQLTAQSQPPVMANILCATAPLGQELAKDIETAFSTDLREVYGCSEVGSMAVRNTAHSQQWTKFEGLTFTQIKSGETTVQADHLPVSVTLEDTLEMIGDGQFSLCGRLTDQVKIAGKRGSLAEVNAVLNTYPNLLDGVVFFPPQSRAVPRLIAIVVLAKGSKADLRDHFRTYLDPAFVPRPIYAVKALPREENGKLPSAKLEQFYRSLIST